MESDEHGNPQSGEHRFCLLRLYSVFSLAHRALVISVESRESLLVSIKPELGSGQPSLVSSFLVYRCLSHDYEPDRAST